MPLINSNPFTHNHKVMIRRIATTERSMETARRKLGAARFEELLAEGAAWSQIDAIMATLPLSRVA